MAAAAKAASERWQTAAPRRRSAARQPRRKEVAAGGRETDLEANTKIVLRRLQEAENDLLISAFWSSALETVSRCLTELLGQQKPPGRTLPEAFGSLHLDSPLGEPDVSHASSSGETLAPKTCHMKCVCYGIGNFATCITARIQLAFLLLFLDKCQEGKRSVRGELTVFYMLHCGTALYNNLLWSNWSVDALSRMVIIGNSFKGLEERLLTRILQKNYPYIAKILEGLEEVEFPQTPEYMDTFNDTSVHWFPTQKLKRVPRDLWTFREEPDYEGCEDLEIIRKTADPPTVSPP
ncbi:SRR1-like protein isoform X3 [Cavia porcellus]|uniref:SRR1-like protein isoform X3 n=1 Tax=Cavia porcellus TaxID=10141 RepID=UPI000661E3D5|nr:SRR1-like protein isoform X2 [Cavia porcellus]